MQIHFEGYVSIAILISVLGLYGHLYLMKWKLDRLWRDYEIRHGINGHDKRTDAAHA